MARGKDDETTPQSDRERRVLDQDQASPTTEGRDHRARGEKEAGGPAWEAAAQEAALNKRRREQTGRDVTGQDQHGRPDVQLEPEQRQQTKQVQEAEQRAQLQRDEQAETDKQNRIARDLHKEAVQEQRALNAGHQAAAGDARGRAQDARIERDQRFANAGHSRESAREDAKQADDLDRGADTEDDPAVAVADRERAASLRADEARGRSVAQGDENRGRAEQARADRAVGEAQDHEGRQRPEPPPPKQQAAGENNLANQGTVAPAGKMRRPRRGTRGRQVRSGKGRGVSRDRGREPGA